MKIRLTCICYSNVLAHFSNFSGENKQCTAFALCACKYSRSNTQSMLSFRGGGERVRRARVVCSSVFTHELKCNVGVASLNATPTSKIFFFSCDTDEIILGHFQRYFQGCSGRIVSVQTRWVRENPLFLRKMPAFP